MKSCLLILFTDGKNNNPAKRKTPFSMVHANNKELIKNEILLFFKKKYIDIKDKAVNGNAKLTTPAWPMNRGENKNKEAANIPT